jgi:hypothetical protein
MAYRIPVEHQKIIWDHFELGKQKIFPKNEFFVAGIISFLFVCSIHIYNHLKGVTKSYCSYFHFTSSAHDIPSKLATIDYKCLLCAAFLYFKPGKKEEVVCVKCENENIY